MSIVLSTEKYRALHENIYVKFRTINANDDRKYTYSVINLTNFKENKL